MDIIDIGPEEEVQLERAWDKLSAQWQGEGLAVPLRDQTTPADNRIEHLNNQPLDHEDSVLLLSMVYQARAEGRDSDIPTLLSYYDNPGAFRKVMWDAARRGRSTPLPQVATGRDRVE